VAGGGVLVAGGGRAPLLEPSPRVLDPAAAGGSVVRRRGPAGRARGNDRLGAAPADRGAPEASDEWPRSRTTRETAPGPAAASRSAGATLGSAASPGRSAKASGRPAASHTAQALVEKPPRERPSAFARASLGAGGLLVRPDRRGVHQHLRRLGPPHVAQPPEQPRPHAGGRPADVGLRGPPPRPELDRQGAPTGVRSRDGVARVDLGG
jgi:hypothetical protein